MKASILIHFQYQWISTRIMVLVLMFLCDQSYTSHGRDFLLGATILNSSDYWTRLVHKKTTRKLRKSREFLATIFSIPVLLACDHVKFKPLMAGVCALIDKDPLPHSGAQSVSRWLLWSSTQALTACKLYWRGRENKKEKERKEKGKGERKEGGGEKNILLFFF